jgi:hypothetical protein
MLRLVICATFLAASGCATTPVQVVGPYANQLSHADVRQITSLIVESEFYNHGSATLEAVGPSKVVVKYVGYGRSLGGGTVSDAGSAYFTAVKRNGGWIEEGLLDMKSRGTAH